MSQWTTLLAVALAGWYLYGVVYQMHLLMNPLAGLKLTAEDLRQSVDPLWARGSQFDLYLFLSAQTTFPNVNLTDFSHTPSMTLVQQKLGLVFNETSASLSKTNDLEIELNITKSSLLKSSREMWGKLQKNSTSVFLHVLLVHHSRKQSNPVVSRDDYNEGTALHSRVQMVKVDKIPKSYRHRYLLSDFGLVDTDPLDAARARMDPNTQITFWKPEVAVRLVSDFTRYPQRYVPDQISKLFVRGRGGKNALLYKPPIHADEIGLTSDKYIALNSSVSALPLKLSYSAMSLQRWLLMQHLEESLRMQKETMQFSDKDMDDVRRLISDTPLSLLLVTIIASLLHLVFELLSFQSDIDFWAKNTSLAGLSVRAVCTDLVSQTIVFLFLIDSDTSLLVTVPSFIAILIQVWKVTKATGLVISRRFALGFLPYPTVEFTRLSRRKAIGPEAGGGEDEKEKEKAALLREKEELLERVSLEADRFATSHMSAVLLPLALGFIVRTLIYDKYSSWYSWGIGSLTGCVYAFGFVLMLPQLFINHRLKSVSHLPWKFLIYKFINTFIDDLFAFIIKQPMMHRLSVFRDDFVFVIYIFQRWKYAVDTDRPMEK